MDTVGAECAASLLPAFRCPLMTSTICHAHAPAQQRVFACPSPAGQLFFAEQQQQQHTLEWLECSRRTSSAAILIA